MNTRPPAVAGTFYPDDPTALRMMVQGYFDEATDAPQIACPPRALIGPHAGYAYSGAVAGSAYRHLRGQHSAIRRVVLLGPAHRVSFAGLATVSASSFSTPLGPVPVDQAAIDSISHLPFVSIHDRAHEPEHCLEVHLPFLMEILDRWSLVPLLFGQISYNLVARVIEALWSDEQTLIVVSSDLSHYHDYDTATQLDRHTARAIETNQLHKIGPHQACGHTAIQGLLAIMSQSHLRAHCVDLRNSGDTSGPTDRVVGYGAFLVH